MGYTINQITPGKLIEHKHKLKEYLQSEFMFNAYIKKGAS
ncbi:hypothetical protein NCCP133_40120 [Cytobacillus sp. NCCP-133]|nr:hypothetical protein NCCP133_40120 [Cytobacillus sp. NCCP-133]